LLQLNENVHNRCYKEKDAAITRLARESGKFRREVVSAWVGCCVLYKRQHMAPQEDWKDKLQVTELALEKEKVRMCLALVSLSDRVWLGQTGQAGGGVGREGRHDRRAGREGQSARGIHQGGARAGEAAGSAD